MYQKRLHSTGNVTLLESARLHHVSALTRNCHPPIGVYKNCPDMNRSSLSVRMKGLEPPLLTEPDPKSGAATNYATCANAVQRYDYFSNFQNFREKYL